MAKKREHDRQAQRTIRDRQKKHTAELEERVRFLQEQNESLKRIINTQNPPCRCNGTRSAQGSMQFPTGPSSSLLLEQPVQPTNNTQYFGGTSRGMVQPHQYSPGSTQFPMHFQAKSPVPTNYTGSSQNTPLLSGCPSPQLPITPESMTFPHSLVGREMKWTRSISPTQHIHSVQNMELSQSMTPNQHMNSFHGVDMGQPASFPGSMSHTSSLTLRPSMQPLEQSHHVNEQNTEITNGSPFVNSNFQFQQNWLVGSDTFVNVGTEAYPNTL